MLPHVEPDGLLIKLMNESSLYDLGLLRRSCCRGAYIATGDPVGGRPRLAMVRPIVASVVLHLRTAVDGGTHHH